MFLDPLRLAVFAAIIIVPATTVSSFRAPAQTAPFSSIEAPHGGHLTVRYATRHQVAVKGDTECTTVRVTAAGVLVIEDRYRKCPRHSRSEIEVTTPALERISFGNGGWIRTVGAFPRQQELVLSVSNGGIVDARALGADRVTASVRQGGRILTIPRELLLARVNNGGVVTYWGNVRVSSSTDHGGVIQKGEPAEMGLPLSDITLPMRNH